MTWDDVKSVIGKAAPLVGGLLGGPAGGAVGTLISSALGVEDTPDAVQKALTTDPNAIIKIKEMELKHKERLEELMLERGKLDLDETKAYLGDVQNARQRQIDKEKATGSGDTNLYVLAWVIVVGFFSLVAVLTFVPIPQDASGVVFMLFGTLASGFGAVVQYFFGSSKGSSDKTKLMTGKEK